MQMKRRPVTADEALVKLETLCVRSEQSSFDLKTKMRRWGMAAADIRNVIDSLIDNKFVDDARFARFFVRDKIRFNRWGRRKVEAHLRAKQISSDIIAEAMLEIPDGDYRAIMREVMAARIRSQAIDNTFEGRTKLYRFAAGRGFEPSLIGNMIRGGNLWRPDDDTDGDDREDDEQ